MLASQRVALDSLEDADRMFIARISAEVRSWGVDEETALNAWLRGSRLDEKTFKAYHALLDAFAVAQAELTSALPHAESMEVKNRQQITLGPPGFRASQTAAKALLGALQHTHELERWLDKSLSKARTLRWAAQETKVRQSDHRYLGWAAELYKTTFPSSPMTIVRRGAWLPALVSALVGPILGATLGAWALYWLKLAMHLSGG